jgi:hypothetical protein
MKKYKIYLATILVGLTSSGCDDIIDLEPQAQLTIDIAMSTLEGLEGAILGVYDRGRFVHSSDDYSVHKLIYSDIIQPGSHLTDQGPFNQYARLVSFDATNTSVRAIWDGYYVGLSRANKIIESIGIVEINESNASEVARRDKVLGEAYYFRAYFHKSLIERWDNIVMADHVFDDPADKGTLANREDVYALMVADLETAMPLLPNAIAGQNGYVSKGVVRHLLSLVYMDMGNWAAAAEAAVQVINDPAYAFAPLENIFSCAHQDNSEIIFSWQFTPNDRSNPQRCSVQLVPLYDRVDGVARTFEQGGRPWSRLNPSDYYWTLFDDPNDLRLDAWHKRFWVYDDEPNLPSGVNLGDIVTPDNVGGTTGFDIDTLIKPTTMKYWEDSTFKRTVQDAEGFRNIILYRLSQAYLIAAEANMRAGQVNVGQPYLDAIRDRAGVTRIPLTEENIINEQARELGHEGHRYPFLKRLGILEERVVQHSPGIGDNFQSFNVRWPIPQNFVDITKVKQNEGYE